MAMGDPVGFFEGVTLDKRPWCTCTSPRPLKKVRPDDAVVYSEAHGRVMIHYQIGSVDSWTDLECEFEGGSGAGVQVWRGRIRARRDWSGEWDAWLEGETHPITEEEWESVLNDEHPFGDPSEFYEEVAPCPKHG